MQSTSLLLAAFLFDSYDTLAELESNDHVKVGFAYDARTGTYRLLDIQFGSHEKDSRAKETKDHRERDPPKLSSICSSLPTGWEQ